MSGRIYKESVAIDESAISRFFEKRADKYNESYPYVSVNYQDSNPELTIERDRAEKERIIPLLSLDADSTLLDIGCGIGRWADSVSEKVAWYHGTDFSGKLIDISKRRFSDVTNVSFQHLKAQDTCISNLDIDKKFNRVIISGLLIYINDESVLTVLNNIKELVCDNALVYIREPVAIADRLTLSKFYSEELSTEYSAVYRTVNELQNIIRQSLGLAGFVISCEGDLFPELLSNRKETKQYYFLLKREKV